MGRFLSADGYVSTGQGILGNNMFAYCLNNPVNGSDPCGTCFHQWKFWEACENCKNNPSRLPIEKFVNKDGTISFYDNQRFKRNSIFHEQFLVFTPNKPNISLKEKSIAAGGSFDLITGGWETEHMDLSLFDFGHAEANFRYSLKEGSDIGALVSIWSPSVSIDFGWFAITYEAEIGAVGYKYQRDEKSIRFGSALGVGGFLQISWG
jgi:hypothetical protein